MRNDPGSMESSTENALWEKLRKHAKRAGRKLVLTALTLLNTFRDPDTPVWAKGAIASALAYFISPLDIIPDFIPLAGYSDDLTTLVAAIAAVAVHIKQVHREKAQEAAVRWFGSDEDANNPS